MNSKLLKEILISGLTRHTAQAIGGAITASGVSLQGGVSIDDFSMVAAGALIQTAAFGWSAWRKARRARKAAKQ